MYKLIKRQEIRDLIHSKKGAQIMTHTFMMVKAKLN